MCFKFLYEWAEEGYRLWAAWRTSLRSSALSSWEKTVNVLKGVLIECDPAMKQFLLYLDECNALGKKFIIQDIDDTYVFVIAELVNVLQERVGELMNQNAFSLTQKWKC